MCCASAVKCCGILKNFAKFTYTNTCTGVFFLKKLQALSKNTFLMEYVRLLLTNIPLKSYSQNFSNILRKTPVKKYCFNSVSDSRPKLKLQQNTILTRIFPDKFWEFFRTLFPLKTLFYYLCMDFIYSVEENLHNTSKSLL